MNPIIVILLAAALFYISLPGYVEIKWPKLELRSTNMYHSFIPIPIARGTFIMPGRVGQLPYYSMLTAVSPTCFMNGSVIDKIEWTGIIKSPGSSVDCRYHVTIDIKNINRTISVSGTRMTLIHSGVNRKDFGIDMTMITFEPGECGNISFEIISRCRMTDTGREIEGWTGTLVDLTGKFYFV